MCVRVFHPYKLETSISLCMYPKVFPLNHEHI